MAKHWLFNSSLQFSLAEEILCTSGVIRKPFMGRWKLKAQREQKNMTRGWCSFLPGLKSLQ